MKKFKYGLAITGSKKELDALITDLTILGYEQKQVDYYYDDSLCTNYDGVEHKMAYDKRHNKYQTIAVPASNKDLVMALAAMIDDNVLHVGEYVVADRGRLPKDKPLKITKISETNPDGVFLEGIPCTHVGGYTNIPFVRKATKDEIFAHFDKKEEMFKIGDVVVIENITFNKELVTPQFGTIDKFEYDKTVVKPTIVPGNLPLGLLWLKNEFRKATSTEIINYNQEVKTELDSSVINPYIEESIVKTRLETLIQDHPELQEDLAELFPEVIEKPDYRGEVDITDKGITFNGNPAAWLRGSGNHEGVSLYLCQNYNWEIVEDSEGDQVLLPTHKK